MYLVCQQALIKACRKVGSQAELARRIGVSRCRLNNWINRGDRIAHQHLLAIEAATQGEITYDQLIISATHSDALENKSTARSICDQLSSLEITVQKKFQMIETLLVQLKQCNVK